jgi:hypothetical protein
MATLAKFDPPRPRSTWVFDDHGDQLDRVAGSLEALGFKAEKESDIETIGDMVEEVWGGKEAPDIIVVDQHWKTELSDLEVLGRKDIVIKSQNRVGEAIGTYLRAVDELRDSTLIMTSVRDEDLEIATGGLEPVVTLSKDDIYRFEEEGLTSDEFLARLGAEGAAESYVNGAEKYLKATARKLGLPEHMAAFLAGARSRPEDANRRLRDLLQHSRDSRARVAAILQIMTSLREAFGSHMPEDYGMGEIGVSLREVLTQGDLKELIALRDKIDDRGGGPIV